MKKEREELQTRLLVTKEFLQETTILAGEAKAFYSLSRSTSDSMARYYYKKIGYALFRQLITDLNILTEDSRSDIRVQGLVHDFEQWYGGRSKELGFSEDIQRGKDHKDKLSESISVWNDLRNNLSAHRNAELVPVWNVDITKISIFLDVSCDLLNTMLRTIAVPEEFPRHTHETSYSITTRVVNLEEETYKAVKDNIVWGADGAS